MASALTVSLGQHSDCGRKPANQDFYGAIIPVLPALSLKGIALTIADGISSSPVSHIAAQTAVNSFLSDYYCTSESWTVRASAQRVIAAANSWLHSETVRARVEEFDRGYVTTFSALILKSRSAHIFHIGDSRIYRLSGDTLEPLTQDHRVALSAHENFLGRALGMAQNIEIDYRDFDIKEGDIFVMTTDGVHDHLSPAEIAELIISDAADLDKAARAVATAALTNGSEDNLTIQIVRVDSLPDHAEEASSAGRPPMPDIPQIGDVFDGWRILSRLHASSRSHVFKAEDLATGAIAVLKLPAVDMHGDAEHLNRMLMEEWIARRISNPHLLKAYVQNRPKSFLYTAFEFAQGVTLRRWMEDSPEPALSDVRSIVEQIADGLQAMHRQQMAHQDLRPENIIIDSDGRVTIIDFGSAKAAGFEEAAPLFHDTLVPGAIQYAAPEYFLGEPGDASSDLYSLGVITYEMLTGRLPYGAGMARARRRKDQSRQHYRPASGETSVIPSWIDAALRRAVHFDPWKRQEEVAEFIADLKRPNENLPGVRRTSFMERDPVRFWQIVSLLLGAIIIVLLAARQT